MLVQRGGNKVKTGTYWNLANGQRVDMNETGNLPGGSDLMYVRMSTAGVLMAGPVLGLAYALFLPFIGIAMTLKLIGRKLIDNLVSVSVKSSSFGWRPLESYLEGKQRKSRKDRKDAAQKEDKS